MMKSSKTTSKQLLSNKVNIYPSIILNNSNSVFIKRHYPKNVRKINLTNIGLTLSRTSTSKIPRELLKINQKRIGLDNAIRWISSLVRFKIFTLDLSIIREENSDSLFRKAVKALLRAKGLTAIEQYIFPSGQLNPLGIIWVLDIISKMTNLTKLSLSFNWCYQLNEEGLSKLSWALMRLKRIRSFSLGFYNCQKLPELTRLGETLTRVKSLRDFTFMLGRPEKSSNLGLSPFLKILGKVNWLRKFSMTLIHADLCGEQLDSLCWALNRLDALSIVELNFLRCNGINDHYVSFIRKALYRLENAKEIAMHTIFCDQIKEHNLDEAFNLKSKSKITRLYLASTKEKPQAVKSLKNISKLLKDFTSLKEFKLNFALGRGLKKTEATELGDSLNLMTDLTKLNISLPFESKLDDKGLALLLTSLLNLNQLEEFTLNAINSQANDNSLYILTEFLKHNLSLTYISLCFADCMKLTDSSLMCIAGIIVLFKNLRNLKINLARCGRITEKGIACIGNALRQTTSITELDLDFSLAEDFSMFMQAQTLLFHEVLAEVLRRTNANRRDECLEYLSEGLKYLNRLKKLRLSFKGCSFISDKGIAMLCDALKCLDNLHELDLDIQSCLGVTNAGIESMKTVLPRMRNLNMINLVFLELTEVTDQALNTLFSMLDHVPVVIICSPAQTLLKPRLSLKIIDMIALCR